MPLSTRTRLIIQFKLETWAAVSLEGLQVLGVNFCLTKVLKSRIKVIASYPLVWCPLPSVECKRWHFVMCRMISLTNMHKSMPSPVVRLEGVILCKRNIDMKEGRSSRNTSLQEDKMC
jgi:hypothetical protein